MPDYYVNKNEQPIGEHEVHKEGCSRMPDEANKKFLGYFSNAIDAVKEAEEFHYNVDVCYYCSREAHRG